MRTLIFFSPARTASDFAGARLAVKIELGNSAFSDFLFFPFLFFLEEVGGSGFENENPAACLRRR